MFVQCAMNNYFLTEDNAMMMRIYQIKADKLDFCHRQIGMPGTDKAHCVTFLFFKNNMNLPINPIWREI